MGLSNSQYDEIMRSYDKLKTVNQRTLAERKTEIFNKLPEYKQLEDEIINFSMEYSEKLLLNICDKSVINSEYKRKLANLKDQKAKLLVANGYAEDYLDPIYTCPICKDEGFVNGEKCSCFIKAEIEHLYDSSRIKALLEQNNFSNVSFDYYEGESLTQFTKAYNASKNMVETFNTDFKNLYFYGTVGTGKSFLSGCIAKEVLDMGHSIIYFTADELFTSIYDSILASSKNKDRDIVSNMNDTLYNTDLLIIDDLGTESSNDFTCKQFFTIINERILRHKSTIISTNLTLADLQDIYDERVFSRICQYYELLPMSGEDIRIIIGRSKKNEYI